MFLHKHIRFPIAVCDTPVEIVLDMIPLTILTFLFVVVAVSNDTKSANAFSVYCWPPQTPWWRHQMETFSSLLAICAGNSPVPGEFHTQRPVTRGFVVSLICRINGWVNNSEAGDLRRHRAHYDVTVMTRFMTPARCTLSVISIIFLDIEGAYIQVVHFSIAFNMKWS